MNATTLPAYGASRRRFLKGSGALVIGFTLAGSAPLSALAQVVSPVPRVDGGGKTIAAAQVDAWLAVGPDGRVTVYSGRVELGTGVRTALAQIAAEELSVPYSWVTMVQGQTGVTPDEGYTAGSKTIQVGGVSLRKAAAQARWALLDMASSRLNAPVEQLSIQDGVVRVTASPSTSVAYGDLVGSRRFNLEIAPDVQTRSPDEYTIVGQSIARADLPGKIFGKPSYVGDVKMPGLLHGRVVRPAGVGATLVSLDESSVKDLPGNVRVVRNGNFVGVVADREEQAIDAALRLKVTWKEANSLPPQDELFSFVRAQPTDDRVLDSAGDVDAALGSAPIALSATYLQPYQMHGSIGPSCAVADVKGDSATVWSHTQGVYPLRGSLAQLLPMPEQSIQVVHVEGSGCYGHNGADDVAGDAALLSKAVGKPVRVQWMRQDEHAWEPKGPAMVMEVSGGTDSAGRVVAWDYAVWTPTHSTRPGSQATNLLPGQLVSEPRLPAPRNGATGGDRNARHNYTFAANRVAAHFLADSPLRPSALRSLGAVSNAFANESFLDELAAAAGVDPVQMRLRHLTDPRAQAVVRTAAERFGWAARPSPANGGGARGQGFAFSRYENIETYVATAVEVEVDRTTGRIAVKRVVVAQDSGLIINPDGVINQVEGCVIQGISRALKEEVKFTTSRVTSVDWRTYPILTFQELPDAIDVVLLDQPDQPAYGVGEPAILTIAPAIGNAVFDAVGVRLRQAPFTPERVRAALV